MLFRTVFHQVNLQAFDRERHAGLQETLGYTLFQLLLETRPLADPDAPLFDDTLEYRVSPLYGRFFRFDIEARDTPGFRIVR